MDKLNSTLGTLITNAIVTFLLLVNVGSGLAQQLAFPGADSYGKYTTGGQVIYVTTIADAGTCSFRETVTTTGTDLITIEFK